MAVPFEGGWGARWARYHDPLSVLGRDGFAARVRQLSSEADVVHLEEVVSAAAGRGLEVPSVVHLQFLVRRDRSLGLPWKQSARDFIELARAEARVRRHARYLVANSSVVADDLRASGARDVTVAPLALDPDDYSPIADLRPPIAGLIGTAAWHPTSDAVDRLLTEVWPRVLRKRPDARLRLAGRGMTQKAFGAPDIPGVEWLGPVDSAQDFLRSVGLLLYPVRRGSGTKIKTLEAMALGVPVVTTPAGAEGVAASFGVTVERDEQRLADATVELLSDMEQRQGQGAEARAHFLAHHAPRPATAPLVHLYERMAGMAPR